MPTLSARVRVSFDELAHSSEPRTYAIRGNVEEMRAEVQKWADLDVELLVLWFGGDTTEAFVASAERFIREVAE
jgi:hypothetical protein